MTVVPRWAEIKTLLLVVELHEPEKQHCRACDGRLGQATGLWRFHRCICGVDLPCHARHRPPSRREHWPTTEEQE